jgi:hypothetical protein
MSKTTKILITALIIFIIALAIGYYFLFIKKPVAGPGDNGGDNPFGPGSGDVTPPPSSSDSSSTDTSFQDQDTVSISRLTRLSQDPVAGITTYTTSGTTTARIMERATAHTYDINLSTGALTRLTNTTIPKVSEAVWPTPTTAIIRYVDDTNNTLRTYTAKIASSTSDKTRLELRGSFLADNITSVSVSPTGSKIFYLTTSTDGAEGIVANNDGSKKTSIFNSSLSEWLPQWPQEGTITVTTKASFNVPGSVYSLTTAGTIRKIISGINGLTTITNPTATVVGFSDASANLSFYTIATNKIIPTSVKTFAEKCVWSKKSKDTIYCAVPTSLVPGSYPDDWYQGLVSFSDALYQINTQTGTATLITNFADTYKQPVDIINPALSSDEHYITFTNKKDLTAWAFNLQQ